MRLRTLLLFTPLIAVSAQAWGPMGHRQVADIAWSQLKHETKVAIAKILMAGDTVTARGKEQAFSIPNQEITNAFLEQTVRPIFDESANWCDVIKGGKSALFEDRIVTDNANSPGVHPPATGNAGEDTRCKSWHYYDKPIAKDPAGHEARESNAIRALGMEEEILAKEANATSPDRKNQAYALYWIEHLFGDLHQPLHCTSNFLLDDKGDAGGNTFKLGIPSPYGNGGTWNLHGYWDSGIDHAIAADANLTGKSAPADVTAAWLTEKVYLPSKSDFQDLNVPGWIDRGWKLAQSNVYKGLEPGGIPDKTYETQHADLCKRQALLAGFRLAEYLNKTLGK
jgi:hypothetical protein